MSQPDLLAQLREARPMAPAELREHIRGIAAAAAEPPRRRVTWRRALVVAIPVAAVLGAAAILLPGGKRQANPEVAVNSPTLRRHLPVLAPPPANATGSAGFAATGGAPKSTDQAALPAPSPGRVQRITTSLELRVANTEDVSDGTKRAVAIAHSLGGFPSSLNVNAAGRTGYADLVLRIPKQNVQRAVARLSALGTVVGENVHVTDITAQVDATSRKIARLETRLTYWQDQPASDEAANHVAALTAEIATLKRGRASIIHAASFATVSVEITTRQAPAPVHHARSPLHNLGVAFRWLGIGAVYVLALGAPFLLLLGICWLVARSVRRRRENALLSGS